MWQRCSAGLCIWPFCQCYSSVKGENSAVKAAKMLAQQGWPEGWPSFNQGWHGPPMATTSLYIWSDLNLNLILVHSANNWFVSDNWGSSCCNSLISKSTHTQIPMAHLPKSRLDSEEDLCHCRIECSTFSLERKGLRVDWAIVFCLLWMFVLFEYTVLFKVILTLLL